jgi:hypothetical protein
MLLRPNAPRNARAGRARARGVTGQTVAFTRLLDRTPQSASFLSSLNRSRSPLYIS